MGRGIGSSMSEGKSYLFRQVLLLFSFNSPMAELCQSEWILVSCLPPLPPPHIRNRAVSFGKSSLGRRVEQHYTYPTSPQLCIEGCGAVLSWQEDPGAPL